MGTRARAIVAKRIYCELNRTDSLFCHRSKLKLISSAYRLEILKELDVQIAQKIRNDVSSITEASLLDAPEQENWLKKHALEPFVRSAIVEPASVFTQFLPEAYQPKINEVQKPSASSGRLAENLSDMAFSMAGAAVVYGGMAVLTKGASASLAEKGFLNGTLAAALTNTTGSMITGAAIYDFARKPHQGETRLSNMAAGVTGFAVFGAGNHLIADKGLALKLAALPAIGALGGLAQKQTSIGISESRWLNSLEIEQAAVQGAMLNTMMPLATKGISKLLEQQQKQSPPDTISRETEHDVLRRAIPITAENRKKAIDHLNSGTTAPWNAPGAKGLVPEVAPKEIPQIGPTELIIQESTPLKRRVVPAVKSTESNLKPSVTDSTGTEIPSGAIEQPAPEVKIRTNEIIRSDKAAPAEIELVSEDFRYRKLTLDIKLTRDRLGTQLFEQLEPRAKGDSLYKTLDFLKSFSEDSRIPEKARVATMREIQKLIEPKTVSTNLSQLDRARIGSDIIDNVRLPDFCIRQLGGTCVIASYEVRLASLYPERYADLIRQVATTGKYQALDGSVTQVPRNSFSNSKTDYVANQASRLFQVTAPNIAWQQSIKRPDGSSVAPGNLIYEMPGKKTFLKDYSTNPKGTALLSAEGKTIDSPHLPREAQTFIDEKIVGRGEIFQITRKSAHEVPGNFYYRDMTQLSEFLRDVSQGKRKDARFPLLIDVDANLIQDGIKLKSTAEPVMNHSATILGLNWKNGNIELNNTWSTGNGDFIREKALTVEQLWTVLPRPKLNEVLASQ